MLNLLGTYKDFRDVKDGWGFPYFMLLSEIRDLSKGYLVNDNVIVEAEVSVRKGDIKILDKETGDLIDFRKNGVSFSSTAGGSLFVASFVDRVPTEEE